MKVEVVQAQQAAALYSGQGGWPRKFPCLLLPAVLAWLSSLSALLHPVSPSYSAPDADLNLARNSDQGPLQFAVRWHQNHRIIGIVDTVMQCPDPFRTGVFISPVAGSVGGRHLTAECLSRNYTELESHLVGGHYLTRFGQLTSNDWLMEEHEGPAPFP